MQIRHVKMSSNQSVLCDPIDSFLIIFFKNTAGMSHFVLYSLSIEMLKYWVSGQCQICHRAQFMCNFFTFFLYLLYVACLAFGTAKISGLFVHKGFTPDTSKDATFSTCFFRNRATADGISWARRCVPTYRKRKRPEVSHEQWPWYLCCQTSDAQQCLLNREL